jgi:release factor glutamine methyltransferase
MTERASQNRRADYLYLLNSARKGIQTVEVLGRTWLLEPGVFSPVLDESTALFTRAIIARAPKVLVEIGCGAGVTSVSAALELRRSVIAADIAPEAVHNTRANVERHRVEEYVSVYAGDFLTTAPTVAEATVFWNSSFIDAEPPGDSSLANAIYDPGYVSHRRFFLQCASRRTELVKVLLGFATLGDSSLVKCVAESAGWQLIKVESLPSVRSDEFRYQMLEFEWGGRAT